MKSVVLRTCLAIGCASFLAASPLFPREATAQGGGACQGNMQGAKRGMMGGQSMAGGQGQGKMGRGMNGGGAGMMGQGMMGKGMNGGAGMMGQGMNKGAGMMGGKGQKDGAAPMMDRQQLLQDMQIGPSDPAAVLAVKDQINLTPQQVRSLENALSRVRKQTDAILTKAQRQQLQSLIGGDDATQSKPAGMHKAPAGKR
jgi:hypothetical protein